MDRPLTFKQNNMQQAEQAMNEAEHAIEQGSDPSQKLRHAIDDADQAMQENDQQAVQKALQQARQAMAEQN